MEENTTVVPAEPTPAPETPAPPEQAPAPSVPAEPTPAEPTEPTEPESRAEKRIKQLVAKVHAAERKAAYYEGVASQGTKAAPTVPPQTAPDPDQFDSYDDFLVAKAKHEIKAEWAAAQETAKAQSAEQTFVERINKAAEKDPEIQEIVNDKTLPISNPMALAIKGSEFAPEVLKYLSRNRDVASGIYQMTPYAAAREIGKIEQKLASQPKPEPPRKVSQAPEPIKPVNPTGSPSVDLDKLPMDEYVKRRNQEQYGNKRR